MKGVVCLDKPKGLSSAAAVAAVRRILGTRAVGHMGTLDPLATGVLLIGVGKATRLFDYFLSKDKVYEAEFTFGASTDTLDGEGKITVSGLNIPSAAEIEAVLNRFVGKIQQLPPKFSAKNIGGERAYTLARRGKEFDLKPAEVQVYRAELLADCGGGVFRFRFGCSAGTYIRSLARDIGAAAGSAAYMSALRRLSCGRFGIEDAVSLKQLEIDRQKALIPIERCVQLPLVEAPAEYAKGILNGVPVRFEAPPQFLLTVNGEVAGIAVADNGIVKIKTYLKD